MKIKELEPFHNFHLVDWDGFREQLVVQLEAIPAAKEPKTIDEFNEMVNILTSPIGQV